MIRKLSLSVLGIAFGLAIVAALPSLTVTEAQFAQARSTLHIPNADYVWYGRVGAPKEFVAHGRFNSIGMNDVEHSEKKPAGVFRIVIIGDSFVEALQVPQKNHFGRLLETELNRRGKYEVLLVGISGNGTRQNYELLKAAARYSPDLVINCFYSENDVRNDSEELTRQVNQQIAQMQKLSKLVYRPEPWHVKTYTQARKRLPLKDKFPVDWVIYTSDYSREWMEAWNKTQSLLLQFRDFSAGLGAGFMILSVANTNMDVRLKEATDPYLNDGESIRWDFGRPDRILKSFCDKNGIAFVPLQPYFAHQFKATGQKSHFEFDGHWNETGHRWVAEVLADELIKNPETRDRMLHEFPATGH